MEQQPVTKTPVVIETARYQIVGNVSVPEGIRLSDYANDPDRAFFALTDVQLAPLEQLERQRVVEFMLVNRREIAVILPGWAEQEFDVVDKAGWAVDFMFETPAT